MNQMNVRRNSPCPCGSGRKFKVCCLKVENYFSHGCLICNGPPEIPSAFAPSELDYKRLGVSEDDYKRLGVPVDKIRIFYYTLCYNCYALPNRDDLIEQKVVDNQVPHMDMKRP